MKNLLHPLLLPLSCLILVSCGGDASSDSSVSSGNSVQATMRDYMNVERDLQTFLSENGMEDNAEVQAAEVKQFEASRAFTQTRKNHPQLKELYAENDRLQSEMIDAKVNGNDAKYDAIMEEFKDVRRELESVARELPEIQEAQKELQRITDEVTEVIASVVESVNAEGKKLADRYRKLHEQFKDMR